MTKAELLEKVRRITKMPFRAKTGLHLGTNDNMSVRPDGRTAVQAMLDRRRKFQQKQKPEVVHNPELEEAARKGVAALAGLKGKARRDAIAKIKAGQEKRVAKASATWTKRAADSNQTPWIDKEGKFQDHSGEGLTHAQKRRLGRHRDQYKVGDTVSMKDRDLRSYEVKQKKKEAEAAAKVAKRKATGGTVAKTPEERMAMIKAAAAKAKAKKKSDLFDINKFVKKSNSNRDY